MSTPQSPDRPLNPPLRPRLRPDPAPSQPRSAQAPGPIPPLPRPLGPAARRAPPALMWNEPPETVCRLRGHADLTGVPISTAMRQPAAVTLKARNQRFATDFALAPAPTQDWLSASPLHAAAASDHVDLLSRLAEAAGGLWRGAEHGADRLIAGPLKPLDDVFFSHDPLHTAFWNGDAKAIDATLVSAGDVADWAGRKFLPEGSRPGERGGWLPSAGAAMRRIAPFEGQLRGYKPRTFGEQVLYETGQQAFKLPIMLLGGLTGGTAIGAGYGMGDQAQKAHDLGKLGTPEADDAMGMAAVVDGLVFRYGGDGAGAILKQIVRHAPPAVRSRFVGALAGLDIDPSVVGQAKRVIGYVLGQTVNEGAVGGANKFADNVISRGIDPHQSLTEDVNPAALAAGGLYAAAHIARHGPHDLKPIALKARTALDRATTLDDLSDHLAAWPLPGRAPDLARSYLDMVNPADAKVYVPLRAVRDHAESLGRRERAAFARQLGPNATVAAGRGEPQVEIPRVDYLLGIAPTPAHEALRGELRLEPDAMSLNEAQAFHAGMDDGLADLARATGQARDAPAAGGEVAPASAPPSPAMSPQTPPAKPYARPDDSGSEGEGEGGIDDDDAGDD